MSEAGGEIDPANEQQPSTNGADQPRRRGRPKGHPKTGGRKKAAAPDCQASAVPITPCTCDGRFASLNLRVDDLYDPRLAEEIVTRIAEGETLTKICADRSRMPSDGTVRKWVRENIDGFTAKYERARALAYDALEDMIRDTADDASGDYIIDAKGKPVFVYESVHRSKVKAENLRWILAHQRPERYGDRVALTGHPDAPPLIPEAPSNRDLARAIFSIFREARIEGEGGEQIDGASLGAFAAAAVGAPKGLFGLPGNVAEAELVADDAPAVVEEIDLADFAAGDLATVGELSIEFIAGTTHADARFWILDRQGQRLTPVTGTEAAKAASRAYAATGRIDVTKRAADLPQTTPLKKREFQPRGGIIDVPPVSERRPAPKIIRSR